jgi:ABC-type transport system involved in cytochrome c biogenesis permease subunit
MQFETDAFIAGELLLALSAVTAIWLLLVARRTAPATGYLRGGGAVHTVHLLATMAGLIAITTSLIWRAINTGHGPFSSMYEFALAFAWGILVMTLIFGRIYKLPVIDTIGVIIALALLIFAGTLSSKAAPLVPALQQSLLLTTHVASAVISYGALTIGFGAAVIYLIRHRNDQESEKLDRLSYQTVIIGFPFLTLVIILGALWANIAWGKYWSWDPKETASLVTWLLYAGYLHARIARGWTGKRAAILLIVGFAAILLTFFGNYVFNGLHSYG